MQTFSKRIAAADLQPGDTIHHLGWSATEDEYEVVSVTVCANGATLIKVNVVSDGGVEFQPSVVYLPGQRVEVVSK